eukprot:CAMPEP_0184969140 /NCGR_PEP_ID=MMETSP1098-20130426/1983_1 /TAXON_ID=89044 /ORGANISM="Spumella elongata, Strain CCAP 955/1" /LENGTH=146 /DNA_ID=CAMNT_0027490875 /DNA_START=452 /DNA_END=893 /DNA_ORIENTATION=-
MSSQDRVFRDRTRILLASERPKECHRCEKPQWRAALGEANTGIRASVGADGALASNSIVVGVAHALAGVSVAASLIRALNHRVSVIRVLYVTDPCGKFGASSSGAIRESPSRLAVNSVVASALVVSPASTVTIATIGAVSRNRGDY